MYKDILNKIHIYILFLFPIFYIIGPAFADSYLTIISIIGLFFFISNKKKIRTDYINLFYFFLFFYFIMVFSSINTEYDILSSINRSLPYIRYFFFTIAIVFFINNSKTYAINMNIVLLGIILILFGSFFQIITSYNIIGNFIDRPDRLSALFNDELIVGTQLLYLLIIYLFLGNFNKKDVLLKKLIPFLLILFSFYIIIRSGERMIFYKFLLSILIFYVFYFKKITNAIFSFISLIIVFTILVSYNSTLSNRFIDQFIIKFSTNEHIINTNENSKNNEFNINNFFSSGHGVLFVTSYEIFLDNPLLGVGPKQFRNACKNYEYVKENLNSKNSTCSTHPHNLYLEILSELGILGLISFFVLLIYLLYFSNYNIYIGLWTFVPIFIFLWPIASSGSLLSNSTSPIFWFMISLFISNNNIRTS